MPRIFPLAILCLAVLLTGADKPKPEVYDPDKLPPGERACGRPGSARSAPCSCMEHRIRQETADLEKCELIVKRADRYACIGASARCSQTVVDRDHAGYSEDSEAMPAQCSRSCHKAKCECCHT